MPQPEVPREEALRRLDKDLDAFDAKRKAPSGFLGNPGAASAGYRVAVGLIGGVFGGLGLGWSLDHFAHTSPFGLIGGLLIGTGGSIFTTVRNAGRLNASVASKTKPVDSGPDDEDDE
jgi:ATP synthase protein I